MRFIIGLLFACILVSAVQAEGQAQDVDTDTLCHVGVYRLPDGRLVDVAPEGQGLRWRTLQGETGFVVRDGPGWRGLYGWTTAPDPRAVSFRPCGDGEILFGRLRGRSAQLEVIDTRFQSGPVSLRGRLVLPVGGHEVPIMVLGHGSERFSAVDLAFRQRLYPAAGIGVFVFDKRGTGNSGGAYTQDFSVLADDVVAAVAEARRLAGRRAGRVGLQGGSQAGWVLPLAASRTAVDFVIVGYGIAASPLTEDRNETLQDLRIAGWGPDVLRKATEVIEATATIMRSHFTAGFGALKTVVDRYAAEPWFRDLKGEFTGEMARLSEADIRRIGAEAEVGTPWDYDAVSALRAVPCPLLWMIAGDDTEGAGPETPAALRSLRREGRPVTIALFPHTEHGIHLLRQVGRTAEHVGYAAGYFRMEIDFARDGEAGGAYEGAQFIE
jgi:alpha-beta hydrolase superfamily lysophospholipase